MKRTELYRKLLAFSLSLIVGFTFIPVLGGAAFAEESAGQDGDVIAESAEDLPGADLDAEIITEDIASETDMTPAEGISPATGASAGKEATADPSDLPGLQDNDEADVPPQAYDPGFGYATLDEATLDADPKFVDMSSMFTWKNRYTGLAHIKTSVSGGKTFRNLQVDDNLLLNAFNCKSSSADLDVDLSPCSIGYHVIFLEVCDKNKNVVEVWYVADVPVTISEKPTYKGVFEVYSKKLNIYPYNMAGANSSYNLYLEYSSNGGKTWKRSGYMQKSLITLAIDQGFTQGGLKPNKKYKTRLRYGTTATKVMDGSTGLLLGPALNTGTKKTGKKTKPPIKSVKVKAIKVKFHKHRVPGHYEWVGNSLIWFKAYTEKYYTCKYKVIVKLKKKPGTKGIWVNGKFVKGNKKKYTVKFTPYPNYFVKKPPKGLKKVTVKIRSYQSKKYYGFSPMYKKKKKVTR